MSDSPSLNAREFTITGRLLIPDGARIQGSTIHLPSSATYTVDAYLSEITVDGLLTLVDDATAQDHGLHLQVSEVQVEGDEGDEGREAAKKIPLNGSCDCDRCGTGLAEGQEVYATEAEVYCLACAQNDEEQHQSGTGLEFSPEVQSFFASRQEVQSRIEAVGFDCTGSGGGLGSWDLEIQNEHWLAYVDYTGGTEPQPGQFQLPGSGGEYSVRLRPLSDVDSQDDAEEGVLSSTVQEVDAVLNFLQQHTSAKTND